jgi:flagellar biosynthesis protein FlhA
VLTTHLAEVVRGHASRLLGREDVRMLTEAVRRTHPAVIEELTPAQLSLGEVQSVLQALLDEQVSIRDLVRIFEALSLRARAGRDLDGLVEAARATLGPAVIAPYVTDATLHVISFEPGLEQRLLEALRPADTGAILAVDPDLGQAVLVQLNTLVAQAEEQNITPVLACAPQVRAAVRRMIAPSMPRLPVVSYAELSGPSQIRAVGVVSGAAVAA